MISSVDKNAALHHLLAKNVLCSILILFIVSHLTQKICAQTNTTESQWNIENVAAGVVDAPALYVYAFEGGERFWHKEEDFRAGHLYGSLHDLLVAEFVEISRDSLRGLSEAELIQVAYDNNVTYYVTDFSALSEQIWAVSLKTNQGEQGQLSQKIDSVSGSYSGQVARGFVANDEQREVYAGWRFIDRQGQLLSVLTIPRDSGEVKSNCEYVGDYFTLDQFASNTGGLTKRYISISSPWSLGFVQEDLKVAGSSAVKDTFTMRNQYFGREIRDGWLELF
jgi:hypothetical protein